MRPASLGMESRAILDSWITASTEASSVYRAELARLHQKPSGNGAGGWAGEMDDSYPWLQVDLQQTTRVAGIATQGRSDYNQWTKTYKLQYGEDGLNFTFYRRIGDQSDTV